MSTTEDNTQVTEVEAGVGKRQYNIKFTLLRPMLGTVPKDKEIYSTYIASKADDLNISAKETETVPENDDEKAKLEEKGWTGFHKDDEGHFIYSYMIKGFLKYQAQSLNGIQGVKNLKNKIDRYVHIEEWKIRIPKICDEPLERPLRAETAQGERIALARSDMTPEGTVLEFTMTVVDEGSTTAGGKAIKESILRALLDMGRYKGLGQWRNAGYGSFSYEMEEIK